VGKTTKLTLDRMEYVKLRKIKDELLSYFRDNPAPDFITFSGSGEPTLNRYIGEVLHFIKQNWPSIPVAVLTNGTLFYDKGVVDAIRDADVVLPSLDAATEETFRRINRPHPELNADLCIRGLVNFREAFKGQIWLEIFILPGYNDDNKELEALKSAILKIRPDRVQLNTLDRPGTMPGLRSATREELESIAGFWDLDRVEIVAAAPARGKIQSFRKDLETAILETIQRRPCTSDDLGKILGMHVNEVNKYLDVLEAAEKIETVRLERGIFYKIQEK
jgi:wyosine [tRNA(Phe)-imidazoG37] synthetase (radical SAM superfamily)